MSELFENHTTEPPEGCPPLPPGFRVLTSDAAVSAIVNPERFKDSSQAEREAVVEEIRHGHMFAAINRDDRVIWGWAQGPEPDPLSQALEAIEVAELKTELEAFFQQIAPGSEVHIIDVDDLGLDPDTGKPYGLPDVQN